MGGGKETSKSCFDIVAEFREEGTPEVVSGIDATDVQLTPSGNVTAQKAASGGRAEYNVCPELPNCQIHGAVC